MLGAANSAAQFQMFMDDYQVRQKIQGGHAQAGLMESFRTQDSDNSVNLWSGYLDGSLTNQEFSTVAQADRSANRMILQALEGDDRITPKERKKIKRQLRQERNQVNRFRGNDQRTASRRENTQQR